MEPSCCKKCMAYRFIVDENVLIFLLTNIWNKNMIYTWKRFHKITTK